MAKRMQLMGAEKTIKTLIDFERRTGKTADEGMRIIAHSAGRILANKVQPYGTKAQKGKEIAESTKKKIRAVQAGVNRGYLPETNDMRDAHYRYRRSSPTSQSFKASKEHPWVERITESETIQHEKTQIAKAGRAKAGWIEAANKLGVSIIKMPKWIARHLGSGYGVAMVSGSGMKTEIHLHNRTPYLTDVQLASDVNESMRVGRQNGIKRMQYLIRQEIKKTKLGS